MLGANYEQLAVNKCPYMVANYQRDGQMRVDDNGGASPNYFPNSFDGIYEDQDYNELPLQLDGDYGNWYERNAEGENDHYTQPGILFRKVMNNAQKQMLIENIAGSMKGIDGTKRDLIINRQLCHFFRADRQLGMAVSKALGINLQMANMAHA